MVLEKKPAWIFHNATRRNEFCDKIDIFDMAIFFENKTWMLSANFKGNID